MEIMQGNPMIEEKQTKIYMRGENVGDLGIPEVYPIKEMRGKYLIQRNSNQIMNRIYLHFKLRTYTYLFKEHTNSVDAIQANPKNEKEFATASHDETIKIWDATKHTVRLTMKGHEKGIWSLNYDRPTGQRVVTCSPDSLVKIWDVKTGKCTETLKGHSHYCYKAVFDNDGITVASVGADKVLNLWDLR